MPPEVTNSLCLTLVATAAILALSFQPTNAQGYIAIENSDQSGSCQIMQTSPRVDVIVMYYPDGNTISGLQFAAPIPSCLGADAVWLGDLWTADPLIGNSQIGATVSYGYCRSGPMYVCTIVMHVFSTPDPCCAMYVVPHPDAASGRVEATTCAGQTVYPATFIGGVFNSGGTTCATMDPPHTPLPDHGATDIATDADLSWTPGDTRNPCGLLAYPYGILSMGTHPDSLLAIGWDMGIPFDPGPLERARTYYWQVVYSFGESGAASPVWAFTTTSAPLAAEVTTWGRLKALYE